MSVRLTDDQLVIDDEHVLWHTLFLPSEDIPFGFHVFVLDTLDTIRALVDPPKDAYARTFTYDDPDADNSIGTIFLASGSVYVGIVAHEATHLAAGMLRALHEPLADAGHENERLAELSGTITSIVWYNVERAGRTTVDVETDDEVAP